MLRTATSQAYLLVLLQHEWQAACGAADECQQEAGDAKCIWEAAAVKPGVRTVEVGAAAGKGAAYLLQCHPHA